MFVILCAVIVDPAFSSKWHDEIKKNMDPTSLNYSTGNTTYLMNTPKSKSEREDNPHIEAFLEMVS